MNLFCTICKKLHLLQNILTSVEKITFLLSQHLPVFISLFHLIFSNNHLRIIYIFSKSGEDLQQQVEELVGELQSKASVYH